MLDKAHLEIHVRHCILYEYRRGKSIDEICKIICNVYGKSALNEDTCTLWYKKFESGDYDLSSEPFRSGEEIEGSP